MIDRSPIAAGSASESRTLPEQSEGRTAPREQVRLTTALGRIVRYAAPVALLAVVAVHGTLGGADALAQRTRVHAAMSAALSNVPVATASAVAMLPVGDELIDQPLPTVPIAAALSMAASSAFTGESARFEPWLNMRVEADDSARKPRQLEREQANIARFIAARYRVTLDATTEFVHHAYLAARDARIDPMLVLAVMSVESSFDPRAQSSAGAQGLMQVLTRVHVEKFMPFGGIRAAFDPVANIRVGSAILREYIQRDGSVEGALKSYVGAALMDNDGGYGAKVLNARDRIAAAAAGKPIPAELAMVAPRTERAVMVRTAAMVDAPVTSEPAVAPAIVSPAYEPARSAPPAAVGPVPEGVNVQPAQPAGSAGQGDI
jgi:soluble lytic murein transglycosylase-like protein